MRHIQRLLILAGLLLVMSFLRLPYHHRVDNPTITLANSLPEIVTAREMTDHYQLHAPVKRPPRQPRAHRLPRHARTASIVCAVALDSLPATGQSPILLTLDLPILRTGRAPPYRLHLVS